MNGASLRDVLQDSPAFENAGDRLPDRIKTISTGSNYRKCERVRTRRAETDCLFV